MKLKEEHRLRTLRTQCWTYERGSTGGWRIAWPTSWAPQSAAYSSPNIIRVIKSRRMRWTGHVAWYTRGKWDTENVSWKTWREQFTREILAYVKGLILKWTLKKYNVRQFRILEPISCLLWTRYEYSDVVNVSVPRSYLISVRYFN
jgi:hypothetical protein